MMLPDSSAHASLIAGKKAGDGSPLAVPSPIDGTEIASIRQLSDDELKKALEIASRPFPFRTLQEVFAFASRLKMLLACRREAMVEMMVWETGFLRRDCLEMFEATLDFLEHFPDYYADQQGKELSFPWDYSSQEKTRRLRLIRQPYGSVAVVLPQNAFLVLGVVAMMCALATGNNILLRPPGQSACSASLLADALLESGLPPEAVQTAASGGREFLEAFWSSEIPLLHYIGGSRYMSDMLPQAFLAGKEAILDGEGNGILVFEEDFPIEEGARLATEGATRYNGETCTSINGALVEVSIYHEVCCDVCARISKLRTGNPFDASTDMGPLFSESQAQHILERIGASGGEVAAGGNASGAYLEPTVVLDPHPDSDLVREGVFGPVLWLKPFRQEEWKDYLIRNRYPLCCTLLSHNPGKTERFIRSVPYARIVLNGDPSIESIYEPWGAYPRSGLNRPSSWLDKYERIVQVDAI